jgi:hypothetical protein
MAKKPEPVQGFMFETVGEADGRNETVCKIIERATTDNSFENGCAFLVEFGDGHQMEAFASELRPWYPL